MEAFWIGFYAALGVICAATVASVVAFIAAALVFVSLKTPDDQRQQVGSDGRS